MKRFAYYAYIASILVKVATTLLLRCGFYFYNCNNTLQIMCSVTRLMWYWIIIGVKRHTQKSPYFANELVFYKRFIYRFPTSPTQTQRIAKHARSQTTAVFKTGFCVRDSQAGEQVVMAYYLLIKSYTRFKRISAYYTTEPFLLLFSSWVFWQVVNTPCKMGITIGLSKKP